MTDDELRREGPLSNWQCGGFDEVNVELVLDRKRGEWVKDWDSLLKTAAEPECAHRRRSDRGRAFVRGSGSFRILHATGRRSWPRSHRVGVRLRPRCEALIGHRFSRDRRRRIRPSENAQGIRSG